ncbi:hypothetical protein TSUD_40860 [Trifolium subterraneum]|nr:hypothetical protein TSUD_40860 [Trifolium subterraneum]
MGSPNNSEGKMEGWLYLIRSNRFGQHYSRKRYFILKDNLLRSYKIQPSSHMEEPFRSAMIDSSIRVTDNGRESTNRKVFFIFTLYNTTNQKDKLKEYPDQAKNLMPCHRRRRSSLRYGGAKSIDWRSSSINFQSSAISEAITTDVIAPSPWKIFGCQNGLRMFKEARCWDVRGRRWGDQSAIMAVGVVDGTSEAIFNTLMSLDPSRSEWDYCINRGSVVDHIDGHTDIIHLQLDNDWLPWGMKPRDLLLQRYWRREDDGTYGGGYVVTPVNKGTQSVVRHMLAIDWRLWRLYSRPSSSRSVTISMLERVAALRELYRTKAVSSEPIAMTKNIGMPVSVQKDVTIEIPQESRTIEELVEVKDEVEDKEICGRSSCLMGLNDSDEFFDVPESTDYDHYDNQWHSDSEQLGMPQHRQSSAAGLVKKLHDLAVQKKGYMDLQEAIREESESGSYGSTLQSDPNCTLPCTWAASDPSLFLVRGATYYQDQQKVKARDTLMELVGVDWLSSDAREDDLSSRPGSIVQQSLAKGGSEFFFVVNMQMPGSPMYNLALYYMLKTPLEDYPLLKSFVEGDDTYRNSRFKLIPYISKGSWIVKQSVGKKACLVGQALEINYFRGKNYLEVTNIANSFLASTLDLRRLHEEWQA